MCPNRQATPGREPGVVSRRFTNGVNVAVGRNAAWRRTATCRSRALASRLRRRTRQRGPQEIDARLSPPPRKPSGPRHYPNDAWLNIATERSSGVSSSTRHDPRCVHTRGSPRAGGQHDLLELFGCGRDACPTKARASRPSAVPSQYPTDGQLNRVSQPQSGPLVARRVPRRRTSLTGVSSACSGFPKDAANEARPPS